MVSALEIALDILDKGVVMATRSTVHLTAVISSIVISIACVAGLSSAYGEELILVHLDSQTGDITKVEHKSEDGKISERKPGSFSSFQGLKVGRSFQYSVIEFMDKKSPALCCSSIIWCKSCLEIETLIAPFGYDRQRNEFKPYPLSYPLSMTQGILKELEEMQLDPSRSVMPPKTRSYHLVVVEAQAGAEIWVVDESKGMVWR
jgi:hypothetical protein